MKIRTTALNFYCNYLKNINSGPVRKPLIKMLRSIDSKAIMLKHSIANVYPKIIQPDVFVINVSLTSACNLRCQGCLYGRSFMPKESLDVQSVKQLLDEMKELKIPRVHFYGGEPLIHKNINDIISYAIDRGIYPSLGSNAMLLNQQTIDKLYKSGLRTINVGLYGIENSYDDYVGIKNQFEKLRKNLTYIKENYPEVDLTLGWLLMKPTCNEQSVDALWEFVKEVDIPFSVSLIHYDFPYFCEGAEHELQLYETDLPRIRKVVDKLISLKQSEPEMLLNTTTGLNAIPDWLIKKSDMKIPCSLYDSMWVGPNGVVRVCQKSHDLGNINESSLKQIFNSSLHKQAAQDCFSLNCTNCHVRFDSRTCQHSSSKEKYKLSNAH